MKKRFTAIFLVVTIIIGIFTLGIGSVSAASNDSEESMGAFFSLVNANVITQDNSINISWNNLTSVNSTSVKGWLIAYSTTNVSLWNYLVADCDITTKVNGNRREVTMNLPSSQTYYFYIFALNTKGYAVKNTPEKGKSLIDRNSIGLPAHFTRTGISAPSLGTVRMMEGFLNVNWKKVSGATRYYVWIRNSTTRKWLKATSTNGSGYTTSSYFNIPAKQLGKLNDVKVRAVFAGNDYTTSQIKTSSNIVVPVYGINWSGNYFNVHWKTIPDAVKYQICRFYNGQKKYFYCDNKSNGYNNITIKNNQVNYVDRGISKSGPYIYQIQAIDSSGTASSWSSYVSVTYNPTNRPSNKQRFVDIANATLGDYGTKYWDKAKEWKKEQWSYYTPPVDWCCMYAGWMLNEMSELEVDVIKKYGYGRDAGLFADGLKEIGKWHSKGTYTPKVGDIIIFGTNPINGRNHVGVVTAVVGGKVYTNEGNTGNVNCEYSRVNRKSYSLNDSYILGYGCTYIS